MPTRSPLPIDPLRGLAVQVKRHHSTVRCGLLSAIDHAFEIGRILKRAKSQVSRRRFQKFQRSVFGASGAAVSLRTCQRYIRMYEILCTRLDLPLIVLTSPTATHVSRLRAFQALGLTSIRQVLALGSSDQPAPSDTLHSDRKDSVQPPASVEPDKDEPQTNDQELDPPPTPQSEDTEDGFKTLGSELAPSFHNDPTRVASLPSASESLAQDTPARTDEIVRLGPGEDPKPVLDNLTPKRIVDLTLKILQPIDLDPASNVGPPNIPVLAHYVPADDGLNLNNRWFGRVFLHPPLEAEESWVDRLLNEFHRGQIDSGIALVPVATSEDWFGRLASIASMVGFWRGRFCFAAQPGSADEGPISQQAYAVAFLSCSIPKSVFAEQFGCHCDLFEAYRVE